MNHSFNIEYAQQYGIEEAIIIENFIYWISKNKANNTNINTIEIEGKTLQRTFTYNSAEALHKLFPYMKPTTIRNSINKLVEKGVLAKGHFGSNSYDRTLWYCFADEKRFIGFLENNNSISQNYQMEVQKNENGNSENAKSLNKYKPNINTNINADGEKKKTSDSLIEDNFPPPQEIKNYIPDEKLNSFIEEWKGKVAGYKPGFFSQEKQAIRTLLREGYKIEDILPIIEKLKTVRQSKHKEAEFYKQNSFSLAFLIGKDGSGRMLSQLLEFYESIKDKHTPIEVCDYGVYKKPDTFILDKDKEAYNMIMKASDQMVYFPDGETISYDKMAKDGWTTYAKKYMNWKGEKKYAIGQ